MRTSRVIGALCAIVALYVVVNGFLTAALEVYGSASELVWTQYSEQEDVDTLVVGTSYNAHALVPSLLDEAGYGTAFNMATPSQSLEESLIGIRTAYEDHGISRVILNVVGLSSAEDDEARLNAPFLRQRARFATLAQTVSAWCEVAFVKGGIAKMGSVMEFFPWEANHVTITPSEIMSNLRMRLNGTGIVEAAETSNPGRTFYGAGYGNYEGSADFSSDDVQPLYQKTDDDWKLAPNKTESLREICSFCADHDIELYVINTPMPAYSVLSYGDGGEYYFAEQEAVQAVLDEFGLVYYDFAMVKPELVEISHSEYYFDIPHLNETGAENFTRAFTRLLDEVASGRDTRELFYDRDGFIASVDYIDALFAEAEVTDAGVVVTGTAWAGPQVNAEYRISERDESGEWAVVRDYDTDPSCTFVPSHRGAVDVKVETREVGSKVDCQYFRELTVFY